MEEIMTQEHFDINRVQISGEIQKIWDWDDDVFFSLSFKEEEDGHPRYVVCRLAGGMIGGELVTLQPDDAITVSGYLTDSPHTETIDQFLDSAKQGDFLESVPDPEPWQEITIERVDTRLDVTGLQMNGKSMHNQVQIQGICVNKWKGGRDRFARLAIYDEHTRIIGHNPRKGLPRRKPHYVTVRFVGGKAGDEPIKLRKKGRLRASGRVHIHFYKQNLHSVLLRTDNADLMEGLAIDQLKSISAVRTSLYVIADSVILYGSRG
jgi:hypothetical protein